MAYFRTGKNLIETLFCVWSDVVKLQNNLLRLQSLWHKQFKAQKGVSKNKLFLTRLEKFKIFVAQKGVTKNKYF